jgi:hypothetical protein
MQRAFALLHGHLWPLRLRHMFLHHLIYGTIFEKKVTEHKMCFDFLYKDCLQHFSF